MSAWVHRSPPAPPLQVSQWLNTADPIELAAQRGRVVMLHAFQMLCPGCVSHGLPQAERVHRAFSRDGLLVVGLHTVFEHHAVMGPDALRAFCHEYRWSFPVGIDQATPGESIPLTMRAYALEGTPSLVLIDRHGGVRLRHFGAIDDLVLGGVIGRLLAEAPSDADADAGGDADADANADAEPRVDAGRPCDGDRCPAGDSSADR